MARILGFPNILRIFVLAGVGPLSGKGPELNRCLWMRMDRGPVRGRTSGAPLICSLVCPECAMLVTWAFSLVWLVRPEPGFALRAGARFGLLGRSPFMLVEIV